MVSGGGGKKRGRSREDEKGGRDGGKRWREVKRSDEE
jgi:hypothetical protein